MPTRIQSGRSAKSWQGVGRTVAALIVLLPLAPHALAAESPAAKRPPDIAPSASKGTLLLPTQLLVTGGRAPERLRRARRAIDALLHETAQDLGLTLDVGEQEVDLESVDRHQLRRLTGQLGKRIVLPRLRAIDRNTCEIELIAADPGASALALRVERAPVREVGVKAAIMLRDLVTAPAPRAEDRPSQPTAEAPAPPKHSAGRAILATNATLYGGFLGLSLQRASGSDDPRLLYPLIGVGAGAGLGAAFIVADEWDVTVGDAWYLAAGAWWPAVSGHLIYAGRFGDTLNANGDEAWSFGLIASTSGVALSVVGLLPGGMHDGGAVLAHSGGALGMIVGGLTEFAITGVTNEVPYAGLGYGGISGWLLASSTAVLFQPEAGRTLSIDLGILLGGLAGASAASPLLFGEQTPAKTRGWVAATGAGLIAGGVVAWWLTIPEEPAPATACPRGVSPYRCAGWLRRALVPTPALVGAPAELGEIAAPGLGARWSGELW